MTHATNPSIAPTHPTLVLISGMPATGKSTLAEELAAELNWPVFTKDTFKELLFDVPGHDEEDFDEEESEQLGAQSIALLLTIADTLVSTGVNVVLEGNFRADLTAQQIEPFLARAYVRHIYCALATEQIVERYADRLENDERHPVHVDTGDAEQLLVALQQKDYGPIRLPIATLIVNTENGFDPPLEDIVRFCQRDDPASVTAP